MNNLLLIGIVIKPLIRNQFLRNLKPQLFYIIEVCFDFVFFSQLQQKILMEKLKEL